MWKGGRGVEKGSSSKQLEAAVVKPKQQSQYQQQGRAGQLMNGKRRRGPGRELKEVFDASVQAAAS